MRIAINGNRHQEGHLEAIEKLVNHLVANGAHVVMSDRFLNYLEGKLASGFALGIDYVPLSVPPQADMALSIGGDGAFLKTALWIGESEVPVAGINTGHLGYLSAFSFDKPDEIYNGLLQGNVKIESRALLDVAVNVDKGMEDISAARKGRAVPTHLTALNELAITRGDIASMLTVMARINGLASLEYLGDGLIVSTPTGSTAYNLSVGGPILDPELQGWVLSPIAAHSLSVRPLVVKDSSVIEIEVSSRGEAFHLAADGRLFTVPIGSRLTISRAPYSVRIIMQSNHTFTETLREKLGMGLRG